MSRMWTRIEQLRFLPQLFHRGVKVGSGTCRTSTNLALSGAMDLLVSLKSDHTTFWYPPLAGPRNIRWEYAKSD